MWRTLWLLLILIGCQARPANLVDLANAEVLRGRLLPALVVLDRLPATDQRYSEGRTLSRAVETRIRNSCEKVIEGLNMREARRDDEALRCFQEALDLWPHVFAARELIRAAQTRRVVNLETGPPIELPGAVTDPLRQRHRRYRRQSQRRSVPP